MSERPEKKHSLLNRRTIVTAGLAVALGSSIGLASFGPHNNPLDFSRLPNGPLNSAPWEYDVDPLTPTYNNEAQVYTKNHATIKDGLLTIDAVKTATGYESSRIETKGKFEFTYGTLTAVAKLPDGVGTWPSVWLLPDETATPRILTKDGIIGNPDGDPFYYAWGGEIDFLETVGAENNPVNNQPAVHTHASFSSGNTTGISPVTIAVPDGQQKFHAYGIHKEPGLIQFTLDGKVVHEVKRHKGDTLAQWPFDDYKYYVVANLAMGGTWGGENKADYPPLGIDHTKSPWRFAIKLTFQAN